MEETQNRNFYHWIVVGVLLIAAVGGFWYWQWYQTRLVFHPRRVAFAEDGQYAFVTGREGIKVFDESRQTFSTIQISLGANTNIVAANDGKAYVTDASTGKVLVVAPNETSATKYVIRDEITIDEFPQFAVVDNTNRRLFVYRSGDQSVTVVNTENNEILGAVAVGREVLGGFADEISGLVYLLGPGRDGILVIDEKTLKIVAQLDLGSRAFVSSISVADSFDQTNQRLYVSKGAGGISVIDTASAKVVKENKPADAPTEIKEMTLNRQSGKLYTVSPWEHALFVFDTKDFSTKKIQLSPLLYPQKAVANEKDGLIYVYSQSKIPQISVLDMEGKELQSIPLGYELSDFRFSTKMNTLFAASQSGGFVMTLKNNDQKFYYKKPEIVETKINWPKLLRIGPLSKRLYVLSDFANTYLAYDRESLDLLSELSLDGGSYNLFAVGESAEVSKTYIINNGINEVWLTDSTDGKLTVLKKIKIDRNVFSGAGLNKAGKLYLTSDNSILVFDTEKDEVVKTIPMSEKPSIFGADQKQERVFVGIGGNIFAVIDGKTDEAITRVPIQINKIGADRTRDEYFAFYILGNDGKTLKMLSTTTNKITKEITLSETFREIAVLPWMKQVYLLNTDGDEILVLDATSLKKIATITVKQQEQPQNERATAMTPIEKTNRVYITHESGKITVIDPSTKTVFAQIYIPNGGIPVSLDADPDAGRFYVANKWVNNVMVFSLKDYSLLATIDQYGETTWVNR